MPGVQSSLPAGRTNLAAAALVAGGAGTIWQNISGGGPIVFTDSDGDTFRRPVGMDSSRITSAAQPHRIIGDGDAKPHTGVDMSTSNQIVAIYAVADGTVGRAGVLDTGCGNGVTISHRGKKMGRYRLNYTVYCHLSSINVAPGEPVSAGDIIGMSGGGKDDPNPGTSTGRHLHFALRVSDESGSSVSNTVMEPYGEFFGLVANDLLDDGEIEFEEEEVEVALPDPDEIANGDSVPGSELEGSDTEGEKEEDEERFSGLGSF